MKIVVLDGYALNPGDLSWEDWKPLGELVVYDRTSPDELLSRAGDAEVLLTNKTVLGEAEIEALPALRYIGVLATGYNVVDLQAARKRGNCGDQHSGIQHGIGGADGFCPYSEHIPAGWALCRRSSYRCMEPAG